MSLSESSNGHWDACARESNRSSAWINFILALENESGKEQSYIGNTHQQEGSVHSSAFPECECMRTSGSMKSALSYVNYPVENFM
jgi:hypothetical protein